VNFRLAKKPDEGGLVFIDGLIDAETINKSVIHPDVRQPVSAGDDNGAF
jgi:hypothetical protein